MAFEAFPRESYQAYEDCGVYYVNEKGRLRSPPGMGSRRRAQGNPSLGQSPPGINGIFREKRHRSVTTETRYDGTTQNVYHPKKLFDVSLMFVADNINLVESLTGFPEIVGEQLFNTAMELGKFGDKNTTASSLQPFYDAYGDAVLESLSLRDEHMVLSEHLDCVLIFTSLRALDLSGCGLGNDCDHDILAVISNMGSLQELCLCDNGLNDESIQRMTTPLRMLGRGPKHLQMLDLSGNHLLTNNGAKYLSAFTSLKVLDLSGTSVTPPGITRIQSKIPSLRAADAVDRISGKFPVEIHSKGWVVPLIHSWLCAPKARPVKTLGTKSSGASAFYGKILVAPPPASDDSGNKKKRQPVIQLVAVDDPNLLTLDLKSTLQPSVLTLDPAASNTGGLSPPSKRLKQSPLDEMNPNHLKQSEVNSKRNIIIEKSLVGTSSRTPKEMTPLRNNFSKQSDRKRCVIKTKCKIGVKSKMVSSASSVVGREEDDDEDDDLMMSYLQARGK